MIGLYGFGLIAVLIVGGAFFRSAAERDHDLCVAAVHGREGLRDHFDWLYGEALTGGDPSPERTAFLEQARAQLDKDIPKRSEDDC